MKKAIVIGGSGFLGSYVLKLLTKEKIETIAVVNKTPITGTKDLYIVKGGISAVDIDLIKNFKPDIIFHCARPTLPRFRKFGREIAARKASRLNTKLLSTILKSGHKPKLVFASGSLMYGNSTELHDESSALNPVSYAKQYFKGEIPINKAVIKDDFPVIVLRFPWLLGNGSWFKWFYMENIKKHKAVPQFGNGKNQMEIIDVEDAAYLLKQYAEGISKSGVFNITASKPMSQSKFVGRIKSEFGISAKNYKDLFPKEPENEAIEAFTSNIILSTRYNKILDAYSFTQISNTLKRIKKENRIA